MSKLVRGQQNEQLLHLTQKEVMKMKQLTEDIATKLEKEFATELGRALNMDPEIAILMMFRISDPSENHSNLAHIKIIVRGHSGEAKVESLATKYGVGGAYLHFRSKGRPKSSVHDTTGRTPGARGFTGGDYYRGF